ncbi:MAG: DUF1660 family phage protein [Acidobacteriota bacterium]
MKLVCPKCGHKVKAEAHIQICPRCKSPMVIVKRTVMARYNRS